MAYATTRTVTGTSDTPTTSDDGGLIQYTSASGKTITLSGTSWVAGRSAFAARISGGGTATFVGAGGVTVNGDTSIASGQTVVCQYTASNTWEIVGTDVLPVASGGTGASTAAGARRNLQALGPVFDVTAYGAVGDGSTNDTAAFNSARDAAVAAGGGVVYVPAGTYVVAGHIMANRVHYMGAHWRSSRLRLPASSTSPIFTTTNFASLFAAQTSNSNTLGNFSITNLTFDGNRANAPSGGNGIEIYGCSYALDHVVVRDCNGIGVVSAWGPSGSGTTDPSPFNADGVDGMEAYVNRLTLVNNLGGNLDFQGPHDSVLTKVHAIYNSLVASPPSWNVRLDGEAGGSQLEQCHFWGGTEYALVAHASTQATSSQFEGSTIAQVRIGVGTQNFANCRLYSPGAGSEAGYLVDNSGGGGSPSSIHVSGGLSWNLPGGALVLTNDGGNSRYNLTHWGTGALLAGTPNGSTFLNGAPAAARFNSASFTLSASDANAFVELNNAALQTITIPTHASVPMPRGCWVWIKPLSSPVDIAPASGVTLNSSKSVRRIMPFQFGLLRKRTDNEWDMVILGVGSTLGAQRFSTSSLTMTATDANGFVEINSASAQTYTALAPADDTLPPGAVIRVACLGAGGLTVQAGTGGSILGGSKAVAQNQVATLVRRNPGEYYCSVG